MDTPTYGVNIPDDLTGRSEFETGPEESSIESTIDYAEAEADAINAVDIIPYIFFDTED